MKTMQVAIISIAALALPGCATGYYQRDYVGYGSAYSSPSYYQSYGRSYSSPGTSITYGRYYVQPGYRPQHHGHHDWHVPAPHFDHHDGGHGGWRHGGLGHREFRQEHHAEHAPSHEHSRPEWRGWRDNGGEHQQHGGWGGRHGRRGE